MGVCNKISGAWRTSHRRCGELIRGRGLYCNFKRPVTMKPPKTPHWSFSLVTKHNLSRNLSHFDPGLQFNFLVSLVLSVHAHWEARCVSRGVWWRWWAWGDWWCHIDGFVCSLLAPAIRSVAQETATCLLQNADARLTYWLEVTASLPGEAGLHTLTELQWTILLSPSERRVTYFRESGRVICSNLPSLRKAWSLQISSVFKAHIL